MQCPMGGTESKVPAVIEFHKTLNETGSHSSSPDRSQRHCSGDEVAELCPLTANPSVLLNVLSYELDPKDLAALEATCKFFRNPANFPPDTALSLPELAAYDMCRNRAMCRPMKHQEMEQLKKRCGGSWKLTLRYVLVGEKNYRREKPQVVAGSGHSIVVTEKGDVYSFGANNLGQLGLGNTEDQLKPCLIRSLEGIRITQAAVGARRTMLVSDAGRVYTFGHDIFGWEDTRNRSDASVSHVSSPKPVDSLSGVFVVQASIGCYFSAVLSREGRVYTFSWGRDDTRLGHNTDVSDVEPRLLSGPHGDAPVAQIAAGNCYLLMLVYQPTGMSVYSLGCGQGGKLGHGNKVTEKMPKLIELFEAPDSRPLSISAGPFHAAALGRGGRVFTWGWSHNGCLGHRGANEDAEGDECVTLPTPVPGLNGVRAVHVSAGRYNTFVVADTGDVYSFGSGSSLNLGFQDNGSDVLEPKPVTSLAGLDEKVVQISATHSYDWQNEGTGYAHTMVLAESGKVFSFGGGGKGQLGLGVKLAEGQETVAVPSRAAVDLV